ncbi:phosphatase PAP2 family protein [Microbacterium sp.]|uniref:phosphatase PAP2 family protein n=1 Tax=Microbacterium sp. TaxID=51671 RepID=UPI0039E2E8DD
MEKTADTTPAPRADDRTITVALQRLVVGVVLLVLAVGVGILGAAGVADTPAIDVRWNGVVDRFTSLVPFAFAMNFLGGGWFATFVVPLAGLAVMLVLRRPWAGVLVVAASVVSAGVVQVIKGISDRVRPEDMLVVSDHGSFPSGHTANAATLATIAVVVFPRVWVALTGAAWALAMGFSRTIVHAHWLTDTAGGAMIGVGAALVVASALTVSVSREAARRDRVHKLGVGRAP